MRHEIYGLCGPVPEQIAGVHTFESGGNSWLDVLELVNRRSTSGTRRSAASTPSTSSRPACGHGEQQELALKLSSFRAANAHVTLEGITLTADERALLHNRGIDFVTDATGSTSSDLAP